MATVRIADEVHPKKEMRVTDSPNGEPTQAARRHDGIYNLRSRISSHDLSLSKTRSMQSQDDDPGLMREDDFKKRQVLWVPPLT